MVKALGMSDGEEFVKCMNALVASDFVEKYVPFGHKKNETHYKLVDPFCLFYLHFVDEKTGLEEDYWIQNFNSPSVISWQGLAFENVCFNHISQIKSALGIQSVSSTQSAWTKKPDDSKGLQIDLLIIRKDNIVNLCEIKFLTDLFEVTNDYKSEKLSSSLKSEKKQKELSHEEKRFGSAVPLYSCQFNMDVCLPSR